MLDAALTLALSRGERGMLDVDCVVRRLESGGFGGEWNRRKRCRSTALHNLAESGVFGINWSAELFEKGSLFGADRRLGAHELHTDVGRREIGDGLKFDKVVGRFVTWREVTTWNVASRFAATGR